MSLQSMGAAATVYQSWSAQNAALWCRAPHVQQHTLHTHPLFSLDAIASLITRYPREHYSLIHMGAQGGRRSWQEGDFGGLTGDAIIRAIADGRLWINLRKVQVVDAHYGAILKQAYAEAAAHTGVRGLCQLSMGILVSSPRAQVYYHSDLNGQGLFQIAGRKRVWLYPPHAPFLMPRDLEDITYFGVEVDLPYESWFDSHATVLELGPGDAAHWALNAPHRVENLDTLNVSVTTEHWTPEIIRVHRLNLANAFLRHSFGVSAPGRELGGPAYWTKVALQAVARRLPGYARVREQRRPIEFTLDATRPGEIVATALPSR